MKVYEQSGYKYKATPTITLKGQWLEIAGILLTVCDARTNLCKVITEQVTETFEGQIRIFQSVIPNTVKVGESIYYSEPLLEYAPGSKVCTAYRNLAREVIGDES